MATADTFNRLVTIMNELREQCPWDKKQTIHTLKPMTLEEVYELTDAISQENWQDIKEELGDVLLHIVFYSKIATEQKQFTIEEVINQVCDKLIRRHPHIYGEVKVKDAEEVKKNWEQIKLQEGKKSLLSGLPNSLPAILKATRMQEKAKQVGFEWEKKEDVWAKVQEEMNELQEAVSKNDTSAIEDEMGDVLFSLVNYARFLNVDCETALEKTNKKFKYRFTQMEEIAANNNKHLKDMSLAEMDALWNEIKKQQ
jgi:XTP/dITP diphosphohydrolase